LAELSKISGVAIADVAAVDAVLKANIASILGLTLPSGAAFLLDTYTGAAAGYSVRRIASGATNLMRIREDSGDTETDIGYDSNGDLDTAAIASHCGSANGYVVTWYDQAGSNDASQSTNASQPQIYNGTAVITENGKPALKADVNGFETTLNPIDNQEAWFFGVAKVTGLTMLVTTTNNKYFAYANSGGTGVPHAGWINMAYYGNGTEITSATQGDIYTALSSQGLMSVKHEWDSTDQTPFYKVAGYANSAGFNNTIFQEWIVWQTSQSSNRTGIETNINSDYLIYQPTDTPTSGLLATYSGAAAAYSVRQLANTAVISMTVRRDSDDEEQRFGFDENGDLDTAGIASFCGSANGYVSQWWDQSTNGNHASQGTAGSQPQIYNGTAVVTENGKPAIDFDGTDDGLNCSTNLRTATGASTVIQVRNVPQRGGAADVQNLLAFHKVQRQLMSPGSAYKQISMSTNETANEIIRFTNADLSGQLLHFATWDGSTQSGGVDEVVLYQDGAQETGISSTQVTGVTPSGTNCIGFRHDLTSQFCLGTFQEVIVYLDDQSSNRTGIESDINTYFSIYS